MAFIFLLSSGIGRVEQENRESLNFKMKILMDLSHWFEIEQIILINWYLVNFRWKRASKFRVISLLPDSGDNDKGCET